VQRAPDKSPPVLSSGKPRFNEAQYAQWRRKHPKHESHAGGSWEPDYLYRRYTPGWFTTQGYVFGLHLGPFGNVDIDVWIDDRGDGREFRVLRWTDSTPGTSAGATPPPDTRPKRLSKLEKGSDLPDSIDPNPDYERLFGKAIARKERVDAAFGAGNTVLYEDGSVVLFLDEGGQYVFRPVPGGNYVVYDPDGKRLSHVWELPADEIPDAEDDADE
jgi:hypothetical protein